MSKQLFMTGNLLKPERNYYLIPFKEDQTRFRLYFLGEEGKKAESAFPYTNPSKKPITLHHYPLEKISETEICGSDKSDVTAFSLKPKSDRKKYISDLQQLKVNIQRGDIYEINFCIEFFAEGITIDPLQIFTRLNKISKAPYASLVKLGSDYIISASPELFLKKERNILSTKPIKGTIRRGENKAEDRVLAEALYNNIKERTENVMAVDVARNDLSRVAERGSVSVNRLYNIETYETVHQMVSTVSCEVKKEKTFKEIIEATFPMASMTGAPKVSAMNLIDKFENFERNYYSGAMGLIQPNGDFELSVNIRCIFYNEKTKRISIAVGSAITHLCDPEKEYEECLLKAQALLRALNAKLD
jgi:para-aminobenzoate synthetase component I